MEPRPAASSSLLLLLALLLALALAPAAGCGSGSSAASGAATSPTPAAPRGPDAPAGMLVWKHHAGGDAASDVLWTDFASGRSGAIPLDLTHSIDAVSTSRAAAWTLQVSVDPARLLRLDRTADASSLQFTVLLVNEGRWTHVSDDGTRVISPCATGDCIARFSPAGLADSRPLYVPPAADAGPARLEQWLPDNRLVYRAADSLWFVNATTGVARPGPALPSPALVSSDGTHAIAVDESVVGRVVVHWQDLALDGSASGSPHSLELPDASHATCLPAGPTIACVVWSTDDDPARRLVAVDRSDARVRSLAGGLDANALVLSPDSRHVAVVARAGTDRRQLAVVSLATGTLTPVDQPASQVWPHAWLQ
jgi:hypothetical protein